MADTPEHITMAEDEYLQKLIALLFWISPFTRQSIAQGNIFVGMTPEAQAQATERLRIIQDTIEGAREEIAAGTPIADLPYFGQITEYDTRGVDYIDEITKGELAQVATVEKEREREVAQEDAAKAQQASQQALRDARAESESARRAKDKERIASAMTKLKEAEAAEREAAQEAKKAEDAAKVEEEERLEERRVAGEKVAADIGREQARKEQFWYTRFLRTMEGRPGGFRPPEMELKPRTLEPLSTEFFPFLESLPPAARRYFESRFGQVAAGFGAEDQASRLEWLLEPTAEERRGLLQRQATSGLDYYASLQEQFDKLTGLLATKPEGTLPGTQGLLLQGIPPASKVGEIIQREIDKLTEQMGRIEPALAGWAEPVGPQPGKGEDPWQTYLSKFPFMEKFAQLSPGQRGFRSSQFAPRTRWLLW